MSKLVDPNGMYFTETSKPFIDDLRDYSLKQIALLFASYSHYYSIRKDNIISFEDRLLSNTMLEAIRETIAECSQVITELFIMENSDQGYSIYSSETYYPSAL